MDMNWIDEIRDPEPRKRYIYNADDYDPQYGDPYYSHGLANRSTPQAATTTAARNPWTASGTT